MRLLLDTHAFLWFVWDSPRLAAIALPHVVHAATLPFHHRDPFDRLIIAQSLTESIPVVSDDVMFDPYGAHRLW
jgi:PIN domain nuclease of toxin-antitoxin system